MQESGSEAQVGLASRDSQALASVQESGSEAQVGICYGEDQVPGLVWEATLFLHCFVAGHVDDLFPYFLAYARWRYPEEASMTSLKEISDLTSPPAWYDRRLNVQSQYSVFKAI